MTYIQNIEEILLGEMYLNDYAKANKKSWSTDEFRLRRTLEFFGEMELLEITPHDVERFRAALLFKKRSKSTTNRHLALLKKTFNLAMDWGYLKKNPVVKVKLFSEHDNHDEDNVEVNVFNFILGAGSFNLQP